MQHTVAPGSALTTRKLSEGQEAKGGMARANGPKPPLTRCPSAAVQLHQTSHSPPVAAFLITRGQHCGRIDLNACSADMLVSEDQLAARRSALIARGGFEISRSQSPWQQYFREMVQPFDRGMTLRDADTYRNIAAKSQPRDNH
ncbi:hypothetical protein [Phaeobacter sp. CECT 5382]|uniref:hypothetical protein n=1 Tax=Phaeobacter sp. CECT 5382 TaxID=1712645 RepID=UPI0012E398C2|nr:hypothetical protein [Phaeobacter sp. CECT 5382]